MRLVERARHCICGCNPARRANRGRDFRQAKIQYLGMSALSDENVCRLDVAVHDAGSVSGVEGVGNIDGDGEKNFRFQSPPANAMLECQAVQKLHGQEEMAVFLTNLMDRADIRMVKRRSGAGFAAEAFQCLGILRDIVGKKFKRDKSAEGDVFGLVNHAHAAATKFLDDAVVRDSTPDHARRITGGKSYVGEKGKSMKGRELADSRPRLEMSPRVTLTLMTSGNWRVTISI